MGYCCFFWWISESWTLAEENPILSFLFQIAVQLTASCYGSAAPSLPPDCHLSSPSLHGSHTQSLSSCLCNSLVVPYCDPTVQQKTLARDTECLRTAGETAKALLSILEWLYTYQYCHILKKNTVLSVTNFSRQSGVNVRTLHMAAALLSNHEILSLSQRVQEVPFPSLGTTGK